MRLPSGLGRGHRSATNPAVSRRQPRNGLSPRLFRGYCRCQSYPSWRSLDRPRPGIFVYEACRLLPAGSRPGQLPQPATGIYPVSFRRRSNYGDPGAAGIFRRDQYSKHDAAAASIRRRRRHRSNGRSRQRTWNLQRSQRPVADPHSRDNHRASFSDRIPRLGAANSLGHPDRPDPVGVSINPFSWRFSGSHCRRLHDAHHSTWLEARLDIHPYLLSARDSIHGCSPVRHRPGRHKRHRPGTHANLARCDDLFPS